MATAIVATKLNAAGRVNRPRATRGAAITFSVGSYIGEKDWEGQADDFYVSRCKPFDIRQFIEAVVDHEEPCHPPQDCPAHLRPPRANAVVTQDRSQQPEKPLKEGHRGNLLC
jgi:hypothetical protein